MNKTLESIIKPRTTMQNVRFYGLLALAYFGGIYAGMQGVKSGDIGVAYASAYVLGIGVPSLSVLAAFRPWE